MVKHKRQRVTVVTLIGLLFAALCWVSFNFMDSVQSSLWENSVKNILESTTRGASLLQRNYLKDLEMLRMLSLELGSGDSTDADRIRDRLKLFLSGAGTLSALVFEDGTGYLDNGLAVTLNSEEQERVRNLSEKSGLLFPQRNRATERRTFTIFTTVDFRDGRHAYLFKGYNVETLYAEYALSFYNNTGFSYVISPDGNIAMRPLHPASNRTLSNLFEIIGEGNNDPEVVESFRDSLQRGKSGVAVFDDGNGEKVVCYVAMPEMAGWYVVSIVPNAEIMREANVIVRQALLICFLGFVGLLAAFLVYARMNRNYRKEIHALAYSDTLTGIRNFQKFREDGDELLNAPGAPKYAMLSIDMLNFKIFNDVMGYAEGDALLKAFSRVLERAPGKKVLTARMVADHFVALLSYEDKEELREYCTFLARAVDAFIVSRRLIFRQELRVGICCTEDSDAAPGVNALLDRAGIALQAIKVKGANLWNFYDHSMRDGIVREKELEARMEKALADGEFQTFIQPKYWLESRRLAGGEALVRWKTRKEGMLSPGEFIPLFEKNRFIIRLDRHMLTSTCRLLRKWLDEGRHVLPLSVNVSRVQFYTPDFVNAYIQIKDEYEIPDGLVELEFTENMFFEDISRLSFIVGRLKHAGFRCSIDDFGSGYSSLNMLKDLSMDALKLDRGFFRTAQDSERARIVVRNMLNMADELRMLTVAEGVETEEQVKFLETSGCDIVQGYIFGRPMPAEEFDELLASADLA